MKKILFLLLSVMLSFSVMAMQYQEVDEVGWYENIQFANMTLCDNTADKLLRYDKSFNVVADLINYSDFTDFIVVSMDYKPDKLNESSCWKTHDVFEPDKIPITVRSLTI